MQDQLSVRPIEESDIPLITAYWMKASPDYLSGMGVDLGKMPTEAQWIASLQNQLQTPVEQKRAYCIIWLLNGQPVGHSNTNPTQFGAEANMHLHLWQGGTRHQGTGTAFVKLTLPHFFNTLQLQHLYCEPYALNPAPHRVIEKAGFEWVKDYVTIPGSINLKQPVKRWHMSRKRFLSLYP